MCAQSTHGVHMKHTTTKKTFRNRDKDWRKPYRGSKRFDRSCRNNGACIYCAEGRQHANKRREPIVDLELDMSIEEPIVQPLIEWQIVVLTQVYENYGERWKPKGGDEYAIHITRDDYYAGYDRLNDIVQSVRSKIEHIGEMYEEYIVTWRVVDRKALSNYQKIQLEFDGVFTPLKIVSQE